jgi:succinate dehydrogenase/fumarate reductase cytochrome b subunit
LHSVTGVFPLGVFLVVHLWTNARALQGEDSFTGTATSLQGLPFLPVIEVFGILLPLAFHSFYGVYLALSGPPPGLPPISGGGVSVDGDGGDGSPFPRNRGKGRGWGLSGREWGLRVSGVVALVFVLYHLWELPVQRAFHGLRVESFYQTLEARLSATYWGIPWTAMLYLVGITATVFHFAIGLERFWMSRAVSLTRAAERRIAAVCWGIGLILFAMGADTLLFFATGTRLYPGHRADSPLHTRVVSCSASTSKPPSH